MLVPFLVLICAVKQQIWRVENNAIVNPNVVSKMSARKNISICQDIPLDIIKARCTELKVTINEFIYGIISLTMKQFCVEMGDTKTESIRLALPFSLRDAPTHARDFAFKNDFAIYPIDMRLVSDLNTGLK
jgi:hypothetical protein